MCEAFSPYVRGILGVSPSSFNTRKTLAFPKILTHLKLSEYITVTNFTARTIAGGAGNGCLSMPAHRSMQGRFGPGDWILIGFSRLALPARKSGHGKGVTFRHRLRD
jgi:hypothetical protein